MTIAGQLFLKQKPILWQIDTFREGKAVFGVFHRNVACCNKKDQVLKKRNRHLELHFHILAQKELHQ